MNANRPPANINSRGSLLFCALATCVLAVEVVLLRTAIAATQAAIFCLLAHLLLAAALGLLTWRAYRRQSESRFLFLLAVSTLVLGPLGVAGSLLSHILWAWHIRHATPFAMWYESLFPEGPEVTSLTLALRGLTAQTDENRLAVVPYMDILSFGTTHQKREVLLRMMCRFEPRFAPALRAALSDPENAIRIQAATALTKIENDFNVRSEQLERRVREKHGNYDALLSLARHYDDFAFTGILDAAREKLNRGRALELYRDCLKLQADQPEIRLAVGRIFLREGNYRQAAEWFEQSIQKRMANAQTVLWHMECLAHLGRYDDLRRLAQKEAPHFATDGRFSLEALSAVRLWAEGSGARPQPGDASC